MRQKDEYPLTEKAKSFHYEICETHEKSYEMAIGEQKLMKSGHFLPTLGPFHFFLIQFSAHASEIVFPLFPLRHFVFTGWAFWEIQATQNAKVRPLSWFVGRMRPLAPFL